MIDPIIEQLRYATRGSIRIGTKNERGLPTKLDTFLFTSADKAITQTLADLYGGSVTAYEHPTEKWQITTEAAVIKVDVPPQTFDPYLEAYTRGGLQKRCTGVYEYSTDWPPRKLAAYFDFGSSVSPAGRVWRRVADHFVHFACSLSLRISVRRGI